MKRELLHQTCATRAPWQLLAKGMFFALRAHCTETLPCHLCVTLRSNKANRIHIEPLPNWYFDVLVNYLNSCCRVWSTKLGLRSHSFQHASVPTSRAGEPNAVVTTDDTKMIQNFALCAWHGQTPVKHPKMHPPQQPIESQGWMLHNVLDSMCLVRLIVVLLGPFLVCWLVDLYVPYCRRSLVVFYLPPCCFKAVTQEEFSTYALHV